MQTKTELTQILHAFEVVFKIIKQSAFTPDSFTDVSTTLATLSTLAKTLDDQIKAMPPKLEELLVTTPAESVNDAWAMRNASNSKLTQSQQVNYQSVINSEFI